jgi:uncharacterized protein (UPF0335 family)
MTDDHNPRAEPGDNSSSLITELGATAQQKLISLVERIERLNEEKDTLAEDTKEVYAEAKGEGFDTAIIRKVIAIRKMDQAKRSELQAMIDLYLEAIGGV